nr:glycogen debranching N-terminal domain-containing protein [Micromonospora sp. DSM 115978]
MKPVSDLSGNLFMISDRQGDVEPAPLTPLGLFFYDTRFLSRWRLTIDGGPLQTLSVEDLHYYESRFFLTPGQPTHYVDSHLSVFRHRWLGDVFQEELSIFNHAAEPVELAVRLEIEADFAEVIEIKDGNTRDRATTTTVEDTSLRFRYERETFVRETIVSASRRVAIDDGGMTFTARVDGHGSWRTDLRVTPLIRGARHRDLRESMRNYTVRSKDEVQGQLERWVRSAPRLRTDYEPLNRAYARSVIDLAALRYRGLNLMDPLPLAGMPWFMTLFGRDSLISSLQSIPFLPAWTVPTLRILALSQGSRRDPFRAEEPGKILQESRYGESAAFNELPHAADFAAADTTPLFVILLDEYERWSGDTELIREMEFVARRAMDWIDHECDLAGGGYLWYDSRPAMAGPVNQSWKGSPEAISFRDGRLAGFPQATCEIQGYVYDAKLRAARLARKVWNDPGYADRLEADADRLRERFNRDFWIADRGYYAIALQMDGEQVDALTSNIGHLLWSGIVERDRAGQIVEHLMGPDLFSGWGVRTLADTQSRYNPLGYHTGAVWPFDNSLIAWGMRRYGFRREPAVIAHAIIDATRYFGGQLPEAFAGYRRTLTKYPVLYSSASMPHATSAGATMLFLRTLLGLEPYGDNLTADPAVPEEMGYVELRDIPGRWGMFDALGRGRTDRDPARR